MSDRDTLFRTLEFQRAKGAEDRVTVESLTLGHFLDKADVLKQNEAALKNLAAQARGEVTIREALQEINVWGAETEFSLTEHAGGTPLIKDWKDIMTGVGDNQSLLLSLKESQYFKNFADEAKVWEERLVCLDGLLHLLNPIQVRLNSILIQQFNFNSMDGCPQACWILGRCPSSSHNYSRSQFPTTPST